NNTQTDNDLNNHNLSVIIVDDDENSAKLLVNLLQQGNKLYLAKTGNEVVDICKKNKDINLILMDIKLPDIDGYAATKKIREFNKKVVIIGQSAYTTSESKKKALEAGCNEYISKPINAIKLFEIINKYI
ncbi:MAG: response regulator, partial [Bacteroidales bacterium]